MKLRWKLVIFAGAMIINYWMLIVDSERISQGERIEKLERKQEELEWYVEIIRSQLVQINPDEERHNPRVPVVLRPQQEPAR